MSAAPFRPIAAMVLAWVLGTSAAGAESLEMAMADDASLEQLRAHEEPAGAPPPPERVEELTWKISRGLRCTVCQGLSVADSPSETAVMMKGRVREMVEAGYSEQQIQDWFVSRYGEWVLLLPRAEGFNWVIWLAPGVAGGVGLAWMLAVMMQWRREPDEVPLPSDQGLVPKDRYEAKLLAEMEDDD